LRTARPFQESTEPMVSLRAIITITDGMTITPAGAQAGAVT
jgi:hypothetical protein